MYRKNITALIGAWNTGNLDELDQYITLETVRHGPASMDSNANSLEELKGVITGFRTAFPDLRLTLDEEIYVDGRSTIRWTFTGTNTGPGEFGTTGKRVSIPGASIAHYEDEKLKEEYLFFDTADFFSQLGLTETTKAAAA